VTWQRRLEPDDGPADISILLPHDQFYSLSFFRTFGSVDLCDALHPVHTTALREKLCETLTHDVNKLCPDVFIFKFVPTFGMPLASALDISESVCCEFVFDDVQPDEPSDYHLLLADACDCAAVADMRKHASALMHAVDRVVALPIYMDTQQYRAAINAAFLKAAAFMRYRLYGFNAATRIAVEALLVATCNSCIRMVDCIDDMAEYRSARSRYVASHQHLFRSIERYKKQQPPFVGYMFVRYDKIPTSLKPCRIDGLRAQIVAYLSDTSSFSRIDEQPDHVLNHLRAHIRHMFSLFPSTVPDFVLDAWLNDSKIARVLGRTKPKGGQRPVCNMQGTVMTLLDKICAAVLDACTHSIDAHVLETQRVLSSALEVDVSMLWTIDSIGDFVDSVPRYVPIGGPHISGNCGNSPTYVFSDVSGCYNAIPQGYDVLDESSIGGMCEAALTHELAPADPADGDDTLSELCARDTLPAAASDALSHLADGWAPELFTDRENIDLRRYHQSVVVKACHLQTQRVGADSSDIKCQLLHLRITDSAVTCIGWTTVVAASKLSAKRRHSSIFLDCISMQRLLATLIILQVLRGGDAVFRSLLGVFQGSYSGGNHADGILKLCEIGYMVSLITGVDRWLIPFFSSSKRYVDDSSFGLNPYAPWQLKSIYPVRGLKFTVDVCSVGSGTSEYMGIHISIDMYWEGWCAITLRHYDKKRCITKKHSLDFDVKCSFRSCDRPILSSLGILLGDLHRISQACSTFHILRQSLCMRFQYWVDGFGMPVYFISGTILKWWIRNAPRVLIRYGWSPCAISEPAAVAAVSVHLQGIFTELHPLQTANSVTASVSNENYSKAVRAFMATAATLAEPGPS
jgi:hypothetical protein